MDPLRHSDALALVHKLLDSGAVKLREAPGQDAEKSAHKDALYLLTLIHLLTTPADIRKG
ncbi:MAG TPA: hypothetical protein VF457_15730 [Burkholderiaceae bacterium]